MNEHILMSSAEHFDVTYRINPWMHPEEKSVTNKAALTQWRNLKDVLLKLNAEVFEFDVPHPDGVFAANAGFAWDDNFIVSTFKFPERQVEEEHWLKSIRNFCGQNGNPYFKKIHMVNYPYEGGGDTLVANEVFNPLRRQSPAVYCGFGFRTSPEVPKLLQSVIDCQVYGLHLCDERFYHLDTCFCPLRDTLVMAYLPAFSDSSKAILLRNHHVLPVPEAEAKNFACNAIVLRDYVIMPTRCPATKDMLTQYGFDVIEVEMSEFMKSGGASKCLTLRLNQGVTGLGGSRKATIIGD